VRSRMEHLGLPTTHFVRTAAGSARKLRAVPDEDLIKAVSASKSIAGVLRWLGIEWSSGAHKVFHRRVAELGIDTTHMRGQGWRAGLRTPAVPPRPLEKVLVCGKLEDASKLRRRLIAEGLKRHRCDRCSLSEWLDSPIPLELHHVNGDRRDHRLENLEVLCPNCHSLTPTFRGRNIGKTG
jgi:hypothetical protein